jgi:hypothetical protein
MPLSSEAESVLESAMKRITGEPGAGSGNFYRPPQVLPENMISYGGTSTEPHERAEPRPAKDVIAITSAPLPAQPLPSGASGAALLRCSAYAPPSVYPSLRPSNTYE